jgi:hypothetical protein
MVIFQTVLKFKAVMSSTSLGMIWASGIRSPSLFSR